MTDDKGQKVGSGEAEKIRRSEVARQMTEDETRRLEGWKAEKSGGLEA